MQLPVTKNEEKLFSPERFNILFDKNLNSENFTDAIDRIIKNGLFNEFERLIDEAPRRKSDYFVGHKGSVTTKKMKKKQDEGDGIKRTEEHLAIVLWNQREELIWPHSKNGKIKLLDYQFPLKNNEEIRVSEKLI